jgi:phospholipase/carboxylesterase
MLETVIIEPRDKATASVIWLHGLGADGHDFESLVPELRLPEDAAIRFVFPHAPIRPVTINSGHEMRAWYDIMAIDIDRKIDTDAIEKSVAQIAELVEAEIAKGVKPEKIVLAGFSQGGVIALSYALSTDHPLAGVLALSSYLPLDKLGFLGELDLNKKTSKFFVAHGTMDPVVPFELGKNTADLLGERGADVSFHSYEMQHSICYEEVVGISHFLLKEIDIT